MRREVVKQVDSEEAVRPVLQWAADMIRRGLPGGPVAVRIGRPTRTLDQNAKLWPMLTDVSKQVEWVKDGERCYMPPEEWKDLFSASLRKQSMSPGIDGGMVILGLHTSRLPKREFADLIEIIYSFGAERGVEWSEHSQKVYAENGEGK